MSPPICPANYPPFFRGDPWIRQSLFSVFRNLKKNGGEFMSMSLLKNRLWSKRFNSWSECLGWSYTCDGDVGKHFGFLSLGNYISLLESKKERNYYYQADCSVCHSERILTTSHFLYSGKMEAQKRELSNFLEPNHLKIPDFDRNPVRLCAEALGFPLYPMEGLVKGREWACVAFSFLQKDPDIGGVRHLVEKVNCHNNNAVW